MSNEGSQLELSSLWKKTEDLLKEVEGFNNKSVLDLARDLVGDRDRIVGLICKIAGSDSNCSNIVKGLVDGNVKSAEDVVNVVEKVLANESPGGSASLACKDYIEFMKALKEAASKYGRKKGVEEYCEEKYKNNESRTKECKEKAGSIAKIIKSSLVDTCYDKKRAEKLFRGLEALSKENSGKNSGERDCRLVGLLFASYVAMLSKDNGDVFEKVEWVPLLLRAVAKKQDKNAYIPVCPGRGDVAAVGYYLLLCCR